MSSKGSLSAAAEGIEPTNVLFTALSPNGGGQMDGTPLWKVFVALAALVVFLFAGAAIICGTDGRCRNYVPTVGNMLNSTFATPFLVSGFNVVLGGHLATSTSLYYATRARALYWSTLQLGSAALVYLTIVVTLFVMPFTGWPNDWANVAVLATLALWMLVVQVSMRRGLMRPLLLHRYGFVAHYVYCACVIPYVVVRAIPTLPIEGKDAGLLVCEVVGGVSLMLFMAYVVAHLWHMRFTIKDRVAVD